MANWIITWKNGLLLIKLDYYMAIQITIRFTADKSELVATQPAQPGRKYQPPQLPKLEHARGEPPKQEPPRQEPPRQPEPPEEVRKQPDVVSSSVPPQRNLLQQGLPPRQDSDEEEAEDDDWGGENSRRKLHAANSRRFLNGQSVFSRRIFQRRF